MKKGYSLIELIVAIGILTILFGISALALLRSERGSTQSATLDTIITDLRDQQTKAMTENSAGGATGYDYGIYFAQSSYTLFRGSSYSQGDSNNFVVTLDGGLEFSNVTFPGSILVFTKGSGEVSGFVNGHNTFALLDTTNGVSKAVSVNKYGTPID